MVQQQGGLQQGGIGDMPYQQLQRQVCEGLAAGPAAAQPSDAVEGQQAGEAAQQQAAPPHLLPPAVRTALEAGASELERLGLHVPRSGHHNV